MKSENLSTLKIHTFKTQAQYEAAKAQGLVTNSDMCLVQDNDEGVATHNIDISAHQDIRNAIPKNLADLTTDATHRVVTDTEKSTWNAKANTSDIPTKVSQLTNDSGFLTEHQDISGKADKSHGIHYIEGTGSTAGTWLGTHADITEYFAGLVLAYKVGVAGASTTTLNINNLGAVTVVKNATTAISTNFAVGSVLFLVYTVDSNGTAYWKAHDYDSNTKTTTGTSNKASTKLYLTGATSQTSSGTTTYSNSKVYIGTNNCLYSNGTKVPTVTYGTEDKVAGESELATGDIYLVYE